MREEICIQITQTEWSPWTLLTIVCLTMSLFKRLSLTTTMTILASFSLYHEFSSESDVMEALTYEVNLSSNYTDIKQIILL